MNCYDKIDNFEELIYHYFERDDKNLDSKGNLKALCPFHKETEPSFSINTESGVYRCFGCNETGNIIRLVRHMEHLESKAANKFILKYYNISEAELKKKDNAPTAPIPQEIIERHKEILAKYPNIRQRLKDDWGISDETINRLQIGFDGERVTFPVLTKDGACWNVRKYKFDTPGKDKVISFVNSEGKKYGQSRLYPLGNLMSEEKEVWLCEGEKDTTVAIDRGLNAITNTTGAGTFLDEWGVLFKGKKVYTVYDNDEAGIRGAEKVKRIVGPFAEFVKNIKLDVENEKEDLTDYFNKYKKTKEDLIKLAENTDLEVGFDEVDLSSYKKVHLSNASRAEYFNKAIEMDCMVTGKQSRPHMPPKVIRVSCPGGLDRCKYCAISLAGGEMLHEYQFNFSKILNLIACSESQQIGWIKKDLKIPEKCKVLIEKVKMFNVEEIQLSPKLELADISFQHVSVMAYYIGQGLSTNKTYTMRGYTAPDPKDNVATQIILEAEPDQASISEFYLTDDDIEELSIFRAEGNPDDPLDTKSIDEKYSDIINMFENGLIYIYGRNYVYEAMDLVFHSPLSFVYGNEDHKKGWLDVLILGDPRTGKNKIAEGLMSYYGMSSKASGESLTMAGLKGAVSGTKENSFIKWGLLPQNDRGFLLLDEISGIAYQDLGGLSSIRSDGECKIVKYSTDTTTARTRLIWLSNPRDGGKVNETAYGVQQVKDLMVKSEDVARFDYALVLSNDDVDTSIINKMHDEVVELKYSKESCRKLIKFIWSRRKSEVVFDRNAIKICMEYSEILRKTYSGTIPLVQGEAVRFKLAKIGASYAARTFNSNDGRTITVEPRHIVAAYNFLKKIYNHPAMMYDKYSMTEKMNARIINEPDLRELMELFNKNDLLEIFLNKILGRGNEVFTTIDIQLLIQNKEPLGDRWTSKSIMGTLSNCNAIEKTNRGFKKTAAFNNWLHNYNDKLKGFK